VALETAKRLDPQVIVAPAMSIGISQHHMRHRGTISATPGAWLSVLLDTIDSMKQAGFSNVLVLNGHGGNVAPCLGVWDQFLQHIQINLQFRSYWDFLDESVAGEYLRTGRCPGHAQEFETAFALAVFPDNVDLRAMHDQADQEPLAATAEAGQAMLQSIVQSLARFVQGMIDGTEVATIPAFH
jgi:creatinine amidohydrolase